MVAIDVGAQQRVVAVGASAGGVKALIRFDAGLPCDLGYAVMVVLHMPTEAPPSQLARILTGSGPIRRLPARGSWGAAALQRSRVACG